MRDGRRRSFLRRGISFLACVVVFVTTYALLLPAITIEKTAACGIEEHQHDDSCFENNLICGLDETEGHSHTEDCYDIRSQIICKNKEHAHTGDCFDENGDLTCALEEHTHDSGCFREDRVLSCKKTEAEPHHHTAACYEKNLTCGKEIHTHSAACYAVQEETDDSSVHNATDAPGGEAADDSGFEVVNDPVLKDADTPALEVTDASGLEATDTPVTEAADDSVLKEIDDSVLKETDDSIFKGTDDSALKEADSPALEADAPLLFSQMLTDATSLYTLSADSLREDGEEADEAKEDFWTRVDEKDTQEVSPSDTIRLYYAYTIPAGTLNASNAEFRFPLPSNVHLTDEQIKTNNSMNDGRGDQALEGTRTPDEAAADPEQVSAWITFENIYDDIEAKHPALLEQDVILTFDERSIEKNSVDTVDNNPIENPVDNNTIDNNSVEITSKTHDDDEDLISGGEEISGFFSIDVPADQIQFDQNDETLEAQITLVEKDTELDIKPIRRTLRLKEETLIEETTEEAIEETVKEPETEEEKAEEEKAEEKIEEEKIEDKKAEEDTETETGKEPGKITETEAESATAEDTETGEKDLEKAPATDTLTFNGPDYTVTATYTKDAGIPAGVSLVVSEIKEDSDEYETYRAQAEDAITQEIAETASWIRLFDICIVTQYGEKLEPKDSVSIQITYREAPGQAEADYLRTVHFTGEEETPQVIGDTSETTPENLDQVIFETDSFSVFAIVGTTIEKTVLASDGHNYRVSVTYGADAGIPEGTKLDVMEILPEQKNSEEESLTSTGSLNSSDSPDHTDYTDSSPNYDTYIAMTENALGWEAGSVSYARVFEISIVREGKKVQPADGTTVDVRIGLADAEEQNTLNVVHFSDDSDEGNVIANSTEKDQDGAVVAFSADGFSVYVIAEHEGGEIITPRVTFHFLDSDYTEAAEGTGYTYSADHYTFVNKAGEYQTTQILKDGEGLEQIANPKNKTDPDRYFYGWYVVDSSSDPGESPTIYTWTEDPVHVLFETPISISIEGTRVTWTLGEASGEGTVDGDGCVHVYLAPLYEGYHFVNFHLGPKEDLGTVEEPGLAHSLMTRKLIVPGSDGLADVRIGNIQAPSPDAVHKIFAGWETVKEEGGELVSDHIYATLDLEGNEILNPEGKDGYYISVAEGKDVDLYPVFAEARWVYFHTGKSGNGATYVGAKYLLTSDDVQPGENNPFYFETLPVSQRNGYNFVGWFTDKDEDENGTGKQITDGNGYLINDDYVKYDTDGTTKLYEVIDGKLYFYKAMTDLHLYAKWVEVPDTSYSVIVWRQKVTDDKTASDAEKTYDYVESNVIESFSGRTLQDILDSDELNSYIKPGVNEMYRGFYYRTVEMSSNTVKGDKTTVVNIYYDRELRAINYYYVTNSVTAPSGAKTAYTYTPTTGATGTQYGLVGDQYIQLTRGPGTTKTEYFLSYYENFDDEYTGTVYDESGNTIENPVYPNIYYRSLNYYGIPRNRVYWRSRNITTYSWLIPEYASGYSLDNEQGLYGQIGDQYVQLSKKVVNRTYSRANYTYTRNTGNSGIQYGVVDGVIQQIYRNNGQWRLTNTWNSTVYSGYHYTRSDSTNIPYTGTLYKLITGTAGTDQSGFEITTDVSDSNLYGSTDSGNNITFFQLSVNEEYEYTYTDANGITHPYTGDRYSLVYEPTGNMVEYLGTRFTRGNSMSGYRMVTWTGLYGQSFAQNRYSWDDVSDYFWSEGTTSSGIGQTFLDAFIQDTNPYNLRTNSTRGNSTIYHYRQQLDGTYTTDDRETAYSSSNGGFNFTNKFDGFTVSTYATGNNGFNTNGGTNSAAAGTSTGNGVNYPLHVYHERNSYQLELNTNYPKNIILYFDGVQWVPGEYDDSIVEKEEHTLFYEAPLTEYGSTGSSYWVPKAPDHYIFDGWYEDATCTVPFNFNSTMPAANKVVYAKWTPETFRVHINPNGAEIDHINHNGTPTFRSELDYYYDDKATYINADYGTTIAEYTLDREYVPISDAVAQTLDQDAVYYYIYSQYYENTGRGLPADLRNALYVTESEIESYYQYYVDLITALKASNPERYDEVTILGPAAWRNDYVSTQKYRRKYANERYEFLGWFKDNETMPYNFSDPVEESFTLTAHWRLDGGYSVMYVPEFIMPDGTLINGNIETLQDPQGGAAYADQATTNVLAQPTALTANGAPVEDDSYIFRGWRLVSIGGTPENPIYIPLEGNKYYQEGDVFTIEAKNANPSGIIYLQAVYEEKESSYRRPEIANLTLDANSGFITIDGEAELGSNQNLDRIGDVGTVALDAAEDQIIFGDLQSNIAVHVDDYAVDTNYFRHPSGYYLLGFDDKSDERDFIATYPADSIISVQRTDEETIYAVWEPMVYINFVNDTGVDDVTIQLSSDDSTALHVVNLASGRYDRVALTDLGNITVKKGESIRLAIPYGAEKNITISGTNTLGPGQVLLWDSKVTIDNTTYDSADNVTSEYSHTADGNTHSHALAKGLKDNHEAFSFDESLIVDETGVTVTFTAIQHDRTLVLHDNYRENTQEIYFANNQMTSDAFDLPTPSTRIGYEFVGWDTERLPDNTEEAPDYPVGTDIRNIGAFFGDDQVKTLYAVWKAKAESGETLVYKIVPEPGDKTKTFDFTVSISGQYHNNYNNRDYSLSDGNQQGNKLSDTFELVHGQYLLIKTSKDVGNSTSTTNRPWIQAIVEKHDKDDAHTLPSTVVLKWQSNTNIRGSVIFDDYAYINVMEGDYTGQFYNTNIEKAAETREGILTVNENDRRVSWTNTDAGGTVFYNNIRQTADISVKKNLVGNAAVGAFSYSASYELDGVTTDLGTFTVTSTSETGYVLEKIPVGAVLTITEAEDIRYEVSTAFENSSADTDSSANTVSFLVPDGGETVTYTNTLKSYPVKIVKVDQSGQADLENGKGVEARFDLSQDGSNIVSGKYTTPTDNVIFDSTHGGNLYVGTYTLTETWTQAGYLGLNEPVTLTLAGNGTLTSDNSGVTVTGNAVQGFVVSVMNRATKNVTVKKILRDPLVSQRTFNFNASYTIDGVTETIPAFSILSSNDLSGTHILTVPVGASLTVTENTTGLTDIYTTHIAVDGGGNNTESNTITIDHVQDAAELIFTNERKTAQVTVEKEMSDVTNETTFPFTAILKNGATPLADYLVFTVDEGGSEIEHKTNSNGQVAFELSHGQFQVLTVPAGAVLVLSETTDDFTADITSSAGVVDSDSVDNSFTMTVSGDDTITFLNRPRGASVILRKIGYDNRDESYWNLQGATFKIYSDPDKIVSSLVTLDERNEFTSDENGLLYEGMIPAGTYYLDETNVPAGYNSPAGMYVLTVNNGVVTLNSTVTIGTPDLNHWITDETDAVTGKTTYTVSIRNTTGVELPSTGGPGTGLFKYLGSILIAGAGLLLWKRRKNRRKLL